MTKLRVYLVQNDGGENVASHSRHPFLLMEQGGERENLRSESTLGSAAFATWLLWGPAVPSGTPLEVLWCVVEDVVLWSLFRWRAFLTLSIVDILKDLFFLGA